MLLGFQPDWADWSRGEWDTAVGPVVDPRSARLAIRGLERVTLKRGQLSLGLDAKLFEVRPSQPTFDPDAEPNQRYAEGVRLQMHLPPDGDSRSSPDATEGSLTAGLAPLDAPLAVPLPSALPATGSSAFQAVGATSLLSALGLEKLSIGFPELGEISSVNVKGITIEVFRGMRRTLRLSAEVAVSDISSCMRFTRVRVEQPGSGRVLSAPVVLWSKAWQLWLPDGYTEEGFWASV